jgi:cytochrome c oxidase cbb3-type subunit 1
VATDASCRVPLLVLFTCGAVWLVVGSVFALIASIKFHSPGFLAEPAWLTYGRVRPAFMNALLYGFCLQAGLGVALWMISRLGRVPLLRGGLIAFGALLWNIGVAAGIGGILAGQSTGFEHLEMPGYAAVFLFLAWLLMGAWGVVTFHQRLERRLYVSQWFLFAALFWFPWIYSTAVLLLVTFPARGMTQAVIGWWYSGNLQIVWLWLVGLAALFYFLPKLTGRELRNRYLALFTFWMVILFGSWVGIPNSAPVPAWIPALSTVGTALCVMPLLTVTLAVFKTTGGRVWGLFGDTTLAFFGLGFLAFLLAGVMTIAAAVPAIGGSVGLTWFSSARTLLNAYGFFSLMMFGAIYYIVPRLFGREFPWPRLARLHFWLATVGILLVALPLAGAGLMQAAKLQNPNVAFVEVAASALHFLRLSTVGDLLLAAGHVLLLANLAGLAARFYRVRVVSSYEMATADLFKAGGVRS